MICNVMLAGHYLFSVVPQDECGLLVGGVRVVQGAGEVEHGPDVDEHLRVAQDAGPEICRGGRCLM